MTDDKAIRDGLLATMQHSTEPMALSDPNEPDMPLVAVNGAFEALTGYPFTAVIGRNCRFLQGRGTDRAAVLRIADCLRRQQGCVEWLVNYRSDGRSFVNLLFISPVFGAGGRLMYFFANQHDLSVSSPELDSFPIGTAHMPVQAQEEFHLLLADMGRSPGPGHARSLEATLAAARQVAFLSTRMEAGQR